MFGGNKLKSRIARPRNSSNSPFGDANKETLFVAIRSGKFEIVTILYTKYPLLTSTRYKNCFKLMIITSTLLILKDILHVSKLDCTIG